MCSSCPALTAPPWRISIPTMERRCSEWPSSQQPRCGTQVYGARESICFLRTVQRQDRMSFTFTSMCSLGSKVTALVCNCRPTTKFDRATSWMLRRRRCEKPGQPSDILEHWHIAVSPAETRDAQPAATRSFEDRLACL